MCIGTFIGRYNGRYRARGSNGDKNMLLQKYVSAIIINVIKIENFCCYCYLLRVFQVVFVSEFFFCRF